MASETSIANRALQLLGAKRITSLSQDNRNAREMSTAYEPVRDALYESFMWKFAVKRAALAASGTAPLFNRTMAFPVPSDFIGLAPPDPNDNNVDRDWSIEGREIITDDAAPLNIRYVSRITDPTLMSPMFRELLSLRLASETCEAITQSNTKLRALEAAEARYMRTVKKSSAFMTIPVVAPDSEWLTARN